MKVTELWKSRQKPTVSFELYPARTPKAEVSLDKTIDRLADLKPDFVSVTFGAGGSTLKGSRELVDKLINEKSLEMVAYVACFGLGPRDLQAALDGYQEIGVENILAVRGIRRRSGGVFTASRQPQACFRFSSVYPRAICFLRGGCRLSRRTY